MNLSKNMHTKFLVEAMYGGRNNIALGRLQILALSLIMTGKVTSA